MVVSQDSHQLSSLHQMLLLSLVLIDLAVEFTGLQLHFGSLFHCCTSVLCTYLFLPCSCYNFLPFDIATMRPPANATTALRTINLRKCTQLGSFNCIPKWARSQGHISPTKNTHCKTKQPCTKVFSNYTVWLVIFAGTNFSKTGQNSGFTNFRGFNFRDPWVSQHYS